MSKFTPGPWVTLPPTSGVDDNWHVTDEADSFVAHVFSCNHSTDEKSKANAELIAAAPEMFALLQKIADWPFPFLNGKGVDEVRQLADEMVKKVEGENGK